MRDYCIKCGNPILLCGKLCLACELEKLLEWDEKEETEEVRLCS